MATMKLVNVLVEVEDPGNQWKENEDMADVVVRYDTEGKTLRLVLKEPKPAKEKVAVEKISCLDYNDINLHGSISGNRYMQMNWKMQGEKAMGKDKRDVRSKLLKVFDATWAMGEKLFGKAPL